MQDNAPVTRTEYDALNAKLTRLETLLRDYLMKRREEAIIEMSHIEDAYRLPRTKEKRVRVGGD